ncbi:MAG: hypothetical protein HYS98_03000 [Deltaproteobacteria bacterium]|nr:hypothetical protein [Deltaproteobacteria bacterium]
MKIRMLLCVLLFGVLSCGEKSIFDPLNNGSNDPGISGVEQGNAGMKHYENNLMGIKFEYPENWNLNESEDKKNVIIDDKPITKVDEETSTLSFSYLTNLDGKRFDNFDKLKIHLRKEQPAKEWEEVLMLSNNTFYWVETQGMFEIGEYYVYDSNSFILKVQYRFKRGIIGEHIIKGIMRSMFIDEEAPEVEKVWFDKKTVKPGENLILFVKMRDKLSGINRIGMGNFLGYKLSPQHFGLEFDRVGAFPEFLGAFPFQYNHFKYRGDDTYFYELNIPLYAPLGKIVMNNLSVQDYFGNETRMKMHLWSGKWLDPIGDPLKDSNFSHEWLDFYLVYDPDSRRDGQNSGTIPSAQVEIVDPERDDYQQDLEAPKIIDAYFDKTFIVGGVGENIEVTLELDDLSEVRYENARIKFGDKYSEDCQRRIGSWVMKKKNVISAPFNFDGCIGMRNWLGRKIGQKKVIVPIDSIWIEDAIGHDLDFEFNSRDPESPNYFRRAKFYINWPEEK